MSEKMSPHELNVFLAQPLHAVMATLPRTGPAQLSPVWFLYEDETLYVSIVSDCAKHRNLARDPRVSVCVDGGRNDVRAVMMYGNANLVTSGDVSEAMRWRIIEHYYESKDEARRYYDRIKTYPSVLVALEPNRLVSQDYRDWD